MSTVVEFVPIPGLVRVRIKATAVNYNAEMYNLLSFKTPGTPTQADVQTAVDRVHQWVQDQYKPLVSAEVNFDEIRGWSGEVQDGPLAITPMDLNGSAATLLGPGRMQFEWAPLAILHAGRGRAKTGKFYAFPPNPEAALPNGYVPEQLTALVNALFNLQNSNTPGLLLGVASESTLSVNPVISFTHTNRLTIQKRRRPDFGR